MTDSSLRLSVHSALWTQKWGTDLARQLSKSSSLGYNGVEISLLGIEMSNPAALSLTARNLGIELKCTTGLSPDKDVSSLDASIRRAGIAYLQRSADVVATLGADLLTGVIYGPWGAFGSPDSRGERLRWAADSLAAVAPEFAARGIVLGIEAVNRFETDLINTSSQATELADMIDEPNVGVHLDTFHMNVEERDIYAAVKTAALRLAHVHVSGPDRGRPIADRFPWDVFFSALKECNYEGWLGVEMFVQAGVPVSSDLRIWRTIEDSPDDAATVARQFIIDRITHVAG